MQAANHLNNTKMINLYTLCKPSHTPSISVTIFSRDLIFFLFNFTLFTIWYLLCLAILCSCLYLSLQFRGNPHTLFTWSVTCPQENDTFVEDREILTTFTFQCHLHFHILLLKYFVSPSALLLITKIRCCLVGVYLPWAFPSSFARGIFGDQQ